MSVAGKGVLFLAGVVLYALLHLIFGNILYAGIITRLKRDYAFEEGDLTAWVGTNLLLIFATISVVWFIYWRLVQEHSDPLSRQRKVLVAKAFNTLDHKSLEWLRESHIGGRPTSEEIGKALYAAKLIDRDYVGFTEVKSDLKPIISRKLKSIDAKWKILLKRAAPKVDPYLIPIGLGVIILGAAILGYGTYRQSIISNGLRSELDAAAAILARARKPESAAASTPRDSMLSGRPVSGREVVQRLEQLESELDGTKKELADTKQKLAAAKQPNQSVVATHIQLGPASEEKPHRYYSTPDKDRISEVFFKLSEIINKPLTKIETASQGLISYWDGLKLSPERRLELKNILQQLDALNTISGEAHTQLDHLLKEYPSYIDVIQQVAPMSQVERERPLPRWQYARNDFSRAISTYEKVYGDVDGQTREGLALTIDPIKDTFRNATANLNDWIHQTNKRIERQRTEILK